MEERHRASAEEVRAWIEGGGHEPSRFRAALLEIPPRERDVWLDLVLGLDELPDDDPELPRGCVPYLPCSVNDLLHVVEHARVGASDVFVDIGSGVGRAVAFVHLLSGASTMGIELQPRLVRAARALADRLRAPRLQTLEGDAAELVSSLAAGTVFFLYCPFSGERLTKVHAALESIAHTRTIRVCSLDLPLPPSRSLVLTASPRQGPEVYWGRSIHPSLAGTEYGARG